MTSIYEIRNLWREAVQGLTQAERALRKLDCSHQADCMADILEAAVAALDAVEKQVAKLSTIESLLLHNGTAMEVI